jgi:hypothetical protein
MKLFATSVLMSKKINSEEMRHYAGYQEAVSIQEAKGLAVEVAEKDFGLGTAMLGVVAIEIPMEVIQSVRRVCNEE